jgi:hypothetical protein
VLHHLARSERLYAASIDEALPGNDPTGRYEEACRRLDETLRTAVARGEDASIAYAGLYGVLQSREEVVDLVLAIESELLGAHPDHEQYERGRIAVGINAAACDAARGVVGAEEGLERELTGSRSRSRTCAFREHAGAVPQATSPGGSISADQFPPFDPRHRDDARTCRARTHHAPPTERNDLRALRRLTDRDG